MKRAKQQDHTWTGNRPEGLPLENAQGDSGLNFMFLAAFPLLLWIFQATLAEIGTAVALMWVLSLGLRLIAVGQQKQFDYDRTEIARAPRLPRKLIGSLLIGVVVMILAGHKFDSLLLPALVGAVATFLSLTAFGLDPWRNKGEETVREMNALMETEDALAALMDRVAQLDDAEMNQQVEAARERIMRPLRLGARDKHAVSRILRPVQKVVALLDEEVSRLETAWDAPSQAFAQRRFLAKLEVLSEGFEGLARRTGLRGARDAFERQADRLIDRMPRESAA